MFLKYLKILLLDNPRNSLIVVSVRLGVLGAKTVGGHMAAVSAKALVTTLKDAEWSIITIVIAKCYGLFLVAKLAHSIYTINVLMRQDVVLPGWILLSTCSWNTEINRLLLLVRNHGLRRHHQMRLVAHFHLDDLLLGLSLILVL